jgi:transcription elongation factor GreA
MECSFIIAIYSKKGIEMANKETLLTQEGYDKIEKELNYLRSTKRKEVAERIKTAIAFGDLSENSEYDEAKNEQAFTEGKIISLEKMLKNAAIIDENDFSTEEVHVGARVKLLIVEDDEEVEYTIVGAAEANPLESKLSNESPVGEALVGKKLGEFVKVTVPDGIMTYKILNINK